jgi:RimJ/RimL family protein N-acetyltransferase
MIRGLRTVCRPIEPGDQAFIHELNADPVVRANVVGWDFPSSLTQQAKWFDGLVPSSTHRWIVEDLEGNALGLTGLWDVDWHSRNALTALKLGGDAPQRGRGLGTDSIMAMMAFAFYDVGLERLYSAILEGNVASLVAYTQRCGWQVEGTSRSHVWRHGGFVNLLQVGVLRADFDQLPNSREYRELVHTARIDSADN